MKAYIQFVGQSSVEGPPSIIVHYDSQRYMFNCREGTQRLFVEERVRMAKLRDIYLTRVEWQNIGGLPGMLLTLADAGVKDLTIHGSKNLTHFMAATRQFVNHLQRTNRSIRTSLALDIDEFDQSTESANKGPLRVSSVVVLPDNQGLFGKKRRRGDEDGDKDMEYPPCTPRSNKNPDEIVIAEDTEPGHPLADTKTQQRQRSFDMLRARLPHTQPFPAATSYICRGPKLPGKFNVNAAKGLGITPGPLFGQLQRGQTITLEDGRTIEPNQVMGPSSAGHLFLIIDCPSLAYVNNLITNDAFKQYQQTDIKDNQPSTVIHLIGQDVLEDKRYRDWMNLFNPKTEHIVSTNDVCAQSVLYRSHAHGQVKLSKLDDEIFPVPKYSNTAARSLTEYTDLPPKCIPLSNMLQYNLEPKPGVDRSPQRPEFDHEKASQQVEKNQEFMGAVTKAREAASSVDINHAFPGDNIKIITLGTGSSIPSKYRNVSATLVKTPEHGSMMLDAGEGTLGQMMRRFGEKLDDELRQLQCIFVSHLHADHHLGVIQLLTKWAKVYIFDRKLYVVAPFIFNTWLHEYSQVESFGFQDKIVMIRNESILTNRSPANTELEQFNGLKSAMGISHLEAVNVIHCRYAYGLTIDHQTGWRLVYSGDTRPCDNLVQAGQNATLLIHEATLEDGMKAEAIAKRHSTTQEAVEIGQRMNARYTLLNHFSQRYPKIPSLSSEQSNVCFSFDLMSVAVKQIPVLPKYTEAISLLFKEEAEAEEAGDDDRNSK
ncbi:beta-lactamase-like protein [Fennellomyces sp. T-0311]|nr:beta-lactamase-like protein [Fennellomyces sp. T-0311]